MKRISVSGPGFLKKALLILATIAITAMISLSGTIGITHSVSAQGSKEVLILACTRDPSMVTFTILVASSANSAGAPAVPSGTNCAQALADALNAGFRVRKVIDSLGSALYTLQKGIN